MREKRIRETTEVQFEVGDNGTCRDTTPCRLHFVVEATFKTRELAEAAIAPVELQVGDVVRLTTGPVGFGPPVGSLGIIVQTIDGRERALMDVHERVSWLSWTGGHNYDGAVDNRGWNVEPARLEKVEYKR